MDPYVQHSKALLRSCLSGVVSSLNEYGRTVRTARREGSHFYVEQNDDGRMARTTRREGSRLYIVLAAKLQIAYRVKSATTCRNMGEGTSTCWPVGVSRPVCWSTR